MEERFIFHGQTTFIDKPKDAVIQNFQNTYVSGDNAERDKVFNEMARLIEIVLGSREMAASDKEEVTHTLHSIAEQVKENRATRLTLKGALMSFDGQVG